MTFFWRAHVKRSNARVAMAQASPLMSYVGEWMPVSKPHATCSQNECDLIEHMPSD